MDILLLITHDAEIMMNGAQLHLLSNHVPVLGVAFAAALTMVGLLRNSDELKKAGLWAFVLTGLSALPAYFTGDGAEHLVEHLPGVAESLIHQHEEAAEKALTGALVLAVAALVFLIRSWRGSALPRWSVPAVLGLSVPVMLTLAYAAHLGGLVRHTEIRAAGSAIPTQADDD
jgi:uncharacterized membrane protein